MTQGQQTRLRAQGAFGSIVLGSSDGTEKHGLRRAGGLQGCIRQRSAVCIHCSPSDQSFRNFERQSMMLREAVQYLARLRHDLRTDAVTGQ